MKGSREKTLPEVLGDYAKRDMARFHMPGHKGFGIPMAEPLCAWDITELPDTDNLHMPLGAIQKTQEAYAEAFGARDCFLLINGSTAGVLAMLLSIGANKRVLLARNAHRSAVSGAVLAGHELSFVYPEPCGVVSAAEIDSALCTQSADAVLIVSPDPYGRCADLVSIAETVHRHGALLFVDAAHGAHFPFGKTLPDLCPEQVDLFCVSAHKTLCAFTQSALLFTGVHCPYEKAHIQNMLSLIQSTSPSYPLMASLDWALHSARDWDEHVAFMQKQRKRLACANGIHIPEAENTVGKQGVFALDPTRLVINVNERGIGAQEAYADLFKRGVAAEMADRENIVFITTPRDPRAWYDRLYDAICTLPYGIHLQDMRPVPPRAEKAVLSAREAMLSSSCTLPLGKSQGHIAANAVGVYPPGVAVLIPGEPVTEEILRYLLEAADCGETLFGLEEKNRIRVVQ